MPEASESDEGEGDSSRPHSDITIGVKGVQLRLVAVKSFFHDAFRTDYEKQVDAEWLWAYIVGRKAVDPHHRILVTSSSIVERLRNDFRAFPSIPPQVVIVIRNVADRITIPSDVPLDLAPLYVAKILRDMRVAAVVVSSVKPGKWLERMMRAGVKWEVEGFEDGMSDLRAIEHAWFLPTDAHLCSHFLEHYDPVYRDVIKLVGKPQR